MAWPCGKEGGQAGGQVGTEGSNRSEKEKDARGGGGQTALKKT